MQEMFALVLRFLSIIGLSRDRHPNCDRSEIARNDALQRLRANNNSMYIEFWLRYGFIVKSLN